MITVNCPKCGAAADMDEKREESIVCKHCKTVITLEKAAPEKYKELIEAREKTEQRYKNILKDYEGGNDAPLKNAMHKVISNTDTADFNINRWFDFIFDAVNIAIKKKDITNLEILKAHARKFDDAFSDYNAADRRLYDSMVFLHPEILNDSEWKVEFEKASADKADVQLLKNNILKCVKEKNDPKLLISVVNVLSASQEEFKDIGEEFLNSILDDEEIAKILSVSFFKKARGGNFAKKLKKYVSSTFKDSEVILKDTLVWNNAETVQKKRKNQKIIIISAVLGAIAIAILAIFLFRNAMVKDSIDIESPSGDLKKDVIKMVYSETPDLSGYTVVFKKNDGTLERVQVTPDMLSGYDKEKVAMQDAKITYKGKVFDVKIEVMQKQLEKTTVSITDNKLVWDRVANAKGYEIYLSKTSGAVGASKYATVEDATSNATLVFDLTKINDMGNVFYVNIIAYNTTDKDAAGTYKYSDSEKSDELKVTKLSAPINIVYNKDTRKLTWSAVEGAKSYTVEINDAPPIRDIEATEIENIDLDLGDNSITITAFPTEQNVIMSVGKVNIHKLSPVEEGSAAYVGNTVTWAANSQSNLYNIHVYQGTTLVHKEEGHSGKAYDVSAWAPGLYTVKIEVASNSLEKVTSEPTEFKIHVGTRITVADGKIDWASLGGTSYDIYVNGAKFDASSTTEKFKSISDIATAAGEYKIYVKVDDSSISETVTVKKLSAPTLSVQKLSVLNQTLKVSGLTASYEFTVDGVPFSGEYTDMLSGLTVAKDYVITAVNKAVAASEIDSDTASLTVTRLEAPIIEVIAGELYVNGSLYENGNSAYTWYVDNVIKAPSLITPGEHTVYAIATGSEENQLCSASSNVLTVKKLSAPVLKYEKTPVRQLICTPGTVTGGTVKYYINGIEGNVDLNSMTGSNEITARYVATAENELNSELSNMVAVVTTNVKLEVIKSGSSQIQANLTEGDTSLSYRIIFKWYKGSEEPAGTKDWGKKTFASSSAYQNQTIYNDVTKLEVTVEIYASDGSVTDVLTGTYINRRENNDI